jgi:membrane-bound lytic murein transglycosylase B
MKRAAIALYAALTFATPTITSPVDTPAAMQESQDLEFLVQEALIKGYDIRPYLSHKSFSIYPDIQRYFKTAEERQKERERYAVMTPEEREKDLDGKVATYKRRINFNSLSARIPRFITDHEESFNEAQERYGVPKELIASILAVETRLGDIKGKYNPFNVYVSLYLKAEKPRQEWAMDQLIELLSWQKKHKVDIFSYRSSYAGAIGYAQFIPSSLNQWWVGSDVYNMHENIQSIGNYLSSNRQDDETFQKAVRHYNSWDVYGRVVMDLSTCTKEKIK